MELLVSLVQQNGKSIAILHVSLLLLNLFTSSRIPYHYYLSYIEDGLRQLSQCEKVRETFLQIVSQYPPATSDLGGIAQVLLNKLTLFSERSGLQ